MIRRAAALTFALALNPAWLHAQDTVLTVSAASADVYKGPSTVTPVIGHASRGTVLPISRNLGSWIKVTWPEAPDGFGYVHVTMGSVGPTRADMPAANTAARTSSDAPATGATRAATSIRPVMRTSVGEPVVPSGLTDGPPASHLFGVGGLVGPMSSYGATARAWHGDRVAFQFGFTREERTSDVAVGHLTATQFEPAVVFGLFDHVSDYVWFRPYVGSGVSLRHETLSNETPVGVTPASSNGLGFRVFGGSELMFAAMPRFALSGDIGYRYFSTPFTGFEVKPVAVSIAGHWYIK
jgi:hypothetical protein